MSDIVVGEYYVHENTGTISKVREIFKPGEYKDPNGKVIECEVVGFESGDAFLNNAGSRFRHLTPDQIAYHVTLQRLMGSFTVSAMQLAREQYPSIKPEEAVDIIANAIAQQARALK